jgi:hypothetical protein
MTAYTMTFSTKQLLCSIIFFYYENVGGGTISAQEFATARQDLTNLLQNPGYVPDQVAAINERARVGESDAAQLQRQRQRERIAQQQRLYDPWRSNTRTDDSDLTTEIGVFRIFPVLLIKQILDCPIVIR